MKLERLSAIIKTIAESESTKIKARFKKENFTRNRKMSFAEIIYYLLNPKSESTQVGINRFFRLLGKTGIHMSGQAFSKARNHFDHSPFEDMMRQAVKEEYGGNYELNTWNGYHVFAIDGSTIALPDKQELRDAFGTTGRKMNSATARVSILMDITNDWIIDARIDHCSTYERKQAHGHIERLNQLPLEAPKLIIFDRGYPAADFIRTLEENKLFFVMRCSRKWNVEIDETLSQDTLVTLSNGVVIRAVRFNLPTGEEETLITNLFDLPFLAFPDLYFMRWSIETKYDIVKNKLEIENFSGFSPNAIRQGFWVSMLLCNVVAVAKKDAGAIVQDSRKGKHNRHLYIPNVNQLIGSLKDQFVCACLLDLSEQRNERINQIICEISRSVVPIRPGRSFWRNPWPRKSKFHFNCKSNV